MRLFVALLLEPALLEALAAHQARIRRLDTAGCVRWVDPHGIHLTLKFFGEVAEADLEDLGAALDLAVRSRSAPLLALGAPGVFPGPSRPRVLWVGVRDQAARLPALAAAVGAATAPLGWDEERRAFQPHLTVGRVREPVRADAMRPLMAAFEALPSRAGEAVRHPRVALVRSHLGPAGARYEVIRQWQLE